MIRSRFSYWCSSKLADMIRGSKKPYALGWDEWDEWHEEASQKHPIRYWIAEKGLKILQNIVYWPSDLYNTVRIYIRNRWIDKTHVLNTGLEPGRYYEFDTKVLHGLFNELVDYVEGELAHTMKAYEDRKYKFVKGRCKQAGLDHLEWACSLVYDEDYCGISKGDKDYGKPTPQAESAQKVRELYEWWTITRPNRPDPYVLAKYDEVVGEDAFKTRVSSKQKACITKISKIEAQYDKEDTQKLIDLIKIRGEIWT